MVVNPEFEQEAETRIHRTRRRVGLYFLGSGILTEAAAVVSVLEARSTTDYIGSGLIGLVGAGLSITGLEILSSRNQE